MENKVKELEKEVEELKDQVSKINEKLFSEKLETDIWGRKIIK